MTTPLECYPAAAMWTGLLDQWIGDDYAMLAYHPKEEAGGDPASGLVLDFKHSLPVAEARMTELAIEAAVRWEQTLRRRGTHYVVAVPSHQAGARDGPVHRLAWRLADELDWLEYLPGLVRHTAVQQSSTAAPGRRPNADAHAASLRFEAGWIHVPDESIIMVDDVLTAGATSAAVRRVLIAATGCRSVTGFFLARTVRRR